MNVSDVAYDGGGVDGHGVGGMFDRVNGGMVLVYVVLMLVVSPMLSAVLLALVLSALGLVLLVVVMLIVGVCDYGDIASHAGVVCVDDVACCSGNVGGAGDICVREGNDNGIDCGVVFVHVGDVDVVDDGVSGDVGATTDDVSVSADNGDCGVGSIGGWCCDC